MSKHANVRHTNSGSATPSLYLERESDGQKREESFNILDAIEPGRKRNILGKRMIPAVFLMAATAIGAGIMLGNTEKFPHINKGSQPTIHRTVALAPPDSGLPAAPLPADIKQPQSEARGNEATDEEPMRLLTAPVGASKTASTEVKAEQVLPTVVPVEISKAAPAKTKKDQAQQRPGKSGRKVAPRERATEKKNQIKRSTGQLAKPSRKDKDVELIAALLTHVSHSGTSSQQSPQTKGKSGDETPISPVSGGGKAVKPGQDVIVRSPGDLTADLVKRCQALGFIEGQLCRARICAGHWGKDPACPSAAHASNASTD